jgi:hypothetical protein
MIPKAASDRLNFQRAVNVGSFKSISGEFKGEK